MTLTFPSTSPFAEMLRIAFGEPRPQLTGLKDRTTEAVLKVITKNPGLMLGEIRDELPSHGDGAIKIALTRLKATGSVRVEGQHHQFKYFQNK